MTTIASVTPTVCALMGLACEGKPISPVMDAACKTGRITKTLIYAPDALGVHLHEKLPKAFERVQSLAPLAIEVRSVLPSVTPVCFASMFTGLAPAEHGIQTYEKPVVKAETLFDRAVSAEMGVAIVAVAQSSIDLIFRERELDYHTEDYDPEVTVRTVELMEGGDHDLIVAYHQEYDDCVHRLGPFNPEALEAVNDHVSSFERLAEAFHEAWKDHNRLLVFAPDHGAHVDPDTGTGGHGLDIPEDMEVVHYYGIFEGGDRTSKSQLPNPKSQ